MPFLNTDSTWGTAILRSFYSALGSGVLTALYLLQAPGTGTRSALIAGSIAALVTLGFRGGVEGLSDRARQIDGNVKSGDVQPIGEGKAG